MARSAALPVCPEMVSSSPTIKALVLCGTQQIVVSVAFLAILEVTDIFFKALAEAIFLSSSSSSWSRIPACIFFKSFTVFLKFFFFTMFNMYFFPPMNITK